MSVVKGFCFLFGDLYLCLDLIIQNLSKYANESLNVIAGSLVIPSERKTFDCVAT